MTRKFLFLFFLFAAVIGNAADKINIIVPASYIGDTAVSRQPLTLIPRAPLPRVYYTNVFSLQPITRYTDTNGVGTFSNILWGFYQLNIPGNPGTSFNLVVSTNLSGNVNVATLITNSAALPPNPSTNYYTMTQVDALLASLVPGGVYLFDQTQFDTNGTVTVKSGAQLTNSSLITPTADTVTVTESIQQILVDSTNTIAGRFQQGENSHAIGPYSFASGFGSWAVENSSRAAGFGVFAEAIGAQVYGIGASGQGRYSFTWNGDQFNSKTNDTHNSYYVNAPGGVSLNTGTAAAGVTSDSFVSAPGFVQNGVGVPNTNQVTAALSNALASISYQPLNPSEFGRLNGSPRPVIPGGTYAYEAFAVQPSVCWWGTNLYVAFCAKKSNATNDSIGLASGSEVDNLTIRSTPVITNGPTGWDVSYVAGPAFFDDGDGTNCIFYFGSAAPGAGETAPASIGVAYTTNMVDWIKYAGNPILTPNANGTNDNAILFRPFVIKNSGTYHLFYNAMGTVGGLSTERIFHAVATNKFGPYTKLPTHCIGPGNTFVTNSLYGYGAGDPQIVPCRIGASNGWLMTYMGFADASGNGSGSSLQWGGVFRAISLNLTNWFVLTNRVYVQGISPSGNVFRPALLRSGEKYTVFADNGNVIQAGFFENVANNQQSMMRWQGSDSTALSWLREGDVGWDFIYGNNYGYINFRFGPGNPDIFDPTNGSTPTLTLSKFGHQSNVPWTNMGPMILGATYNFYGGGSGLSNLNAATMSSGNIPLARYGFSPATNASALTGSRLVTATGTGGGLQSATAGATSLVLGTGGPATAGTDYQAAIAGTPANGNVLVYNSTLANWLGSNAVYLILVANTNNGVGASWTSNKFLMSANGTVQGGIYALDFSSGFQFSRSGTTLGFFLSATDQGGVSGIAAARDNALGWTAGTSIQAMDAYFQRPAAGNIVGNTNGFWKGYMMATNGLASLVRNKQACISVTVGASPFTWTNDSPTNSYCPIISGGTISAVSVNGSSVASGLTLTGITTLPPIQPGESVTITYSVAPTLNIKPL